MSRYLARRLLQAVPLLFVISLLTFLIVEIAPGDAAQMYIDPNKGTDPAYIQQVRETLGLDQPVYVRYVGWLRQTLTGDLGFSFRNRRLVALEIGDRLPNTLLLSGVSLALSFVIAIPIGVISALKRYTLTDYVLSTAALAGISIPIFWIALLLIQVFAIQLGWLPATGMTDVRQSYTGWQANLDVLRHMILPTITLSLAQIAGWSRYQRSALLEVLGQDYMRTAQGKGLRERRILLVHALRNSLIPMVTLIGISVPTVVTGAFITETIFSWPGIGRLGVEAVTGRDYPVIMAVTMLSALMIVVGNLLADLAYAWVDQGFAMNSAVANLSPKPAQSQQALVWRQFRRHKLAVASAVVLILLALVSVFAEQIAPHDPNAINASYSRGKPQPPTAEYLLGTDNYGRDYLARTMVGLRISLVVGVTAVAFQLVIGITVGALAGYFGGWIDNLLMRITDIFLSVPAFLLLLIMAGILGGGLFSLIIAIGALNWMTVARLVRAEILSLKEREYVVAGRSIGVPAWRLILVYLLPNTAGSIIVAATLAVPSAILTESALSFLGLGVPPPNASLGNMLGEAQQWIRTSWWIWIVPGVAISMTVLAFNFVGDGLRDALDPKLRD